MTDLYLKVPTQWAEDGILESLGGQFQSPGAALGQVVIGDDPTAHGTRDRLESPTGSEGWLSVLV